jgi:hypothetical protein
MVSPEPCLGWGMQVQVYCSVREALVNDRHEQFGEWWCNRNTAVALRQLRIPFAFV